MIWEIYRNFVAKNAPLSALFKSRNSLHSLHISLWSYFSKKVQTFIYAVETSHKFSEEENKKLRWLFDGATPLASTSVKGRFIGPRKEMITPWSTNAVEITQNMGLEGITRIEEFHRVATEEPTFDKMLSRLYDGLNSKVFTTSATAAPIEHIADISEYNKREGLALSAEEEDYLRDLAKRLAGPSPIVKCLVSLRSIANIAAIKFSTAHLSLTEKRNLFLYSSLLKRPLRSIQTSSFRRIRTTLRLSKARQ